MLDRLKLVVNVKLGTHLDEAEKIDATNKRVKNKAVPALVLVVQRRVNCITSHQRVNYIAKVGHGFVVILFSFALNVSLLVLNCKVRECLRSHEVGCLL